MRELHVVGRGPAVHSLPLICRSDLSELELADLRLAIATASTDPMTEADRANLRIVGFCSLDLHDYLGLAELDPDLFQEQSG